MNLPEVSGYILWLLPDDLSSRFYRCEIERIASMNNSVPFEPHITISRVPDADPQELIKDLQALTKNLSKFKTKFSEPVYGDHAYQKITLPVIPSTEFINTCNLIDSFFGSDVSKRSFPHFSLFYGNHTKVMLRNELLALKKKTFPPVTINYLALFKLEGLPCEWKMEFRFELS